MRDPGFIELDIIRAQRDERLAEDNLSEAEEHLAETRQLLCDLKEDLAAALEEEIAERERPKRQTISDLIEAA